MATIWRADGFRFVIWPGDHVPPHVHVFHGGREIVINLGEPNQLPYVRDNFGMQRNDENRALLISAVNKESFLARWEEIINA